MTRIERHITAAAPAGDVWTVIAALDSIERWNPGVAWATCDTPGAGIGTTRTCGLRPRGRLEEIVAIWEPGVRLGFSIGPHGAVRSAETELVLREVSVGTEIVAVADYHLAFGPLGPAVDRVVVRRQMGRMLETSLGGLKRYVESQRAKELS